MDIFNAKSIETFFRDISGTTMKDQVRTSLWMNVGLATSQVLFLDFLVRSKDPIAIANQFADLWARQASEKTKIDLQQYRNAAEAPGQQGAMAKAVLPKVEAAANETDAVIIEISEKIREMGQEASRIQKS